MNRIALILAALALPAAIAAQESPPAKATEALQDCSAHKFETVVERTVDGEPRKSRVKLCGTKGQSQADWIVTLEDAIAKLGSNIEVPADARAQIIAAISAEIARLRDPAAVAAAPVLTPRAPPPPRDFRDDYASLPALPPPTVDRPPAATLGGASADSRSAPVLARPVPATALIAAPSLGFDCYVPGELSGPAPCIDFQRETLITVRAKSDVPAGVELHFERNGSDRATVALGPMKSGKSRRMPLPSAVCQGVGDGRLTIAVWTGSRPARTEGPFTLRCG